MVRILVTGSRSWDDRTRIARSIMAVINRTCPMLLDDDGHPDVRDTSGVVVVHGACREGADALAQDVCDHMGIVTERHPANWRRYGKRAGFLRNVEMVESLPDVCLAFIKACRDPKCDIIEAHGTHGASHCADYAERWEVPTLRWGWVKDEHRDTA